jgi:ABC-type uncharacterized transport system substrate-binding protein
MTPARPLAGLARGLALLLLLPGAVAAQPSVRVPRVGVLAPGSSPDATIDALRDGLEKLGYLEGQSLRVDLRYADWHLDRLAGLARELVRLQPDVLFTHTTPGVLAARAATTTIPIVVGPAGVETLLQQGLVASLARPRGNITGLVLLGRELEAKRLQLLKEIAPAVTRVAVLVNPENPAWRRYPADFEPAGHALGLGLIRVEARDAAALEQAFSAMARDRADGVLVVTDALLTRQQKRIAELAVRHRLPSIAGTTGFARAGGLAHYGPSVLEMAGRAAGYVARILKGASPGELPVEQPDRFELIVNLRTATALGLTIPASVITRADEVIR